MAEHVEHPSKEKPAHPPKEKPVVIFIDDELKILQIVKQMLENPEYDLYAFDNAEEVLKLIGQNAVAVVISDNRMPHMKGTELFEKIKTLSPKTVRILTTAFYDDQLLEAAVNRGEIFRFLKKPLDFTQMKEAIHQGLDHFKKSVDASEKSSLFEKLLHKLTEVRHTAEKFAAEITHLRKIIWSLVALLTVLVLSFAGYVIYEPVARVVQYRGAGEKIGYWIKYTSGVALDTKYDLMWMTKDFRNIEQRHPGNWDEAMSWVDKMNEKKYGGFDDWRAPSIEEYQKSYDPDRARLAFNGNKDFPVGYPRVFDDGGGYGFWSTDLPGEEGSALLFFFAGGYEKAEKKDYNDSIMSIRLVRNP